jgi:hypothetical protein
MKIDRLFLRMIIVLILMFIFITNFIQIKPSNYITGHPVTTSLKDERPDIFQHPGEKSCVPSATSELGAYYTDSVGGLCGDQQYVNRIGHGYTLDGIGGSLLSQ